MANNLIINPVKTTNNEDEEGGGTGTVGYLLAVFNKIRRAFDGQGQFGICPHSQDPNNLLGKRRSHSCDFRESPKSHPLLSTQQFSGIDDKLTPIPAENFEAVKQFPEKRLENQHRLQKKRGLGGRKSVTLTR